MSRGRVFDTRAAAEYCGLAVQTVYNLVHLGVFPAPHKNGRKNAWYADELDAYNDAHVTDPGAVHVERAA